MFENLVETTLYFILLIQYIDVSNFSTHLALPLATEVASLNKYSHLYLYYKILRPMQLINCILKNKNKNTVLSCDIDEVMQKQHITFL